MKKRKRTMRIVTLRKTRSLTRKRRKKIKP